MIAELCALAALLPLALLAYVLVALWRRHAIQHLLLDVPNDRSSHVVPTPMAGGVALVALNLSGWLVISRLMPGLSFGQFLTFAGGASAIAIVSFVDDLGHVPYPVRLVVHAAAAFAFVIGVTFWRAFELPVLGTIALGVTGAALTALWIAGLTNAFNFMDGVDGLAAGQAAAAGGGWVVLGLATGHPLLAALGGCLGATSLGFLLHNWQPARIFMGDVGSTYLGFSFAVLPVVAARYDLRLALCGALFVWPALFDSTFTIVRRLRGRRNIFTGHREFLFHRLVDTGWSHAAAATLYLTLPLLGALIAFTWEWGSRPLHGAIALLIVAPCAGLWLLVRREEQRQIGSASTPAPQGDGRVAVLRSVTSASAAGDGWSLGQKPLSGGS